jgi:hypothetical protein
MLSGADLYGVTQTPMIYFDVTHKIRALSITQRANCGHGSSEKLLEIAFGLLSRKAGRAVGMTVELERFVRDAKDIERILTERGFCVVVEGEVRRCWASGSTDGTYYAASYRKARACVSVRLRICCLNGFSFSLIGNCGWAIKPGALARSAIYRELARSSRKIAQCPCL